ncbi:MAG: transaldolase family protein [Planctomycetota bacterium]|nr:transaldolase family protein [Planctomycetota bacterium]
MSQTASLGNIPTHNSEFAKSVREFCTRDYTPPAASLRETFPSQAIWSDMLSTGTAAWLDTGDIDAARELWTQEFTALTTNNTLLNKEVQKGLYDQLVPDAAAMLKNANPEISEEQLVLEIAFILNAVHALKLVSTFDADVSVELHTNLSRDSEATYQFGKRFHAINPERFIVKVPLTPEGLVGARRLSNDGVRLNFTLGFSARQNYAIANIARPTWVNVFMGRNGSFVKDNGFGDGENIGEKSTLASQRMLRDLRASKSLDVLQIGASIRSGQQCFDLLGLDVFTIPTGAAKQYIELNPAPDTVVDQTDNDPEVHLTKGHADVAKMWEVSDEFKAAIDGVVFDDSLTGEAIREHLAANGIADLFPALSDEDLERVSRESKIPQADSWKDRVAAGTASWDGLLSEAALASFHQDQMALDGRIRKSL